MREQLGTSAFLEALDAPADYQMAARRRLHVDAVVRALAGNAASSARAAFLALTADAIYLAHPERVIGLIVAAVEVRPAPTVLVRFWDRYSRPDDGFTPTTIGALVENGSVPAIALFERKLAGPGHPDDDKRAWDAHRRHDPSSRPASPAGLRALATWQVEEGVAPSLVEALFDYRPQEPNVVGQEDTVFVPDQELKVVTVVVKPPVVQLRLRIVVDRGPKPAPAPGPPSADRRNTLA